MLQHRRPLAMNALHRKSRIDKLDIAYGSGTSHRPQVSCPFGRFFRLGPDRFYIPGFRPSIPQPGHNHLTSSYLFQTLLRRSRTRHCADRCHQRLAEEVGLHISWGLEEWTRIECFCAVSVPTSRPVSSRSPSIRPCQVPRLCWSDSAG